MRKREVGREGERERETEMNDQSNEGKTRKNVGRNEKNVETRKQRQTFQTKSQKMKSV